MSDNQTPDLSESSEPAPKKGGLPPMRWGMIIMISLALAFGFLWVTGRGAPVPTPLSYSEVFNNLEAYEGWLAQVDDTTGKVVLAKEGSPVAVGLGMTPAPSATASEGSEQSASESPSASPSATEGADQSASPSAGAGESQVATPEATEGAEPVAPVNDAVSTVVPRTGVQDAVTALTAAGVQISVIPPTPTNGLVQFLLSMIPLIVIIGFLVFFLSKRGMGIPGLGLGKKSGTPVEIPKTRFSDVAGAEEATGDLQEVVNYLHDASTYTAAGASIPRGFLLVGPPGTGKTLLARAVAGEAGVPFFAIAGSDLVEMFVGLGASRVRELFSKARAAGKAIIFIDEIDAVGKARGGGVPQGASDERESTLNQLLVEMDGFDRNDSIIVLAATNRVDVLDSALTRPGRFDRKIVVPAPDRTGRLELLRLYAKGKTCDDTINWESIARRTAGMTGADIAQLLNEAALNAARRKDTVLRPEDLENSLATAMLGRERKSAVMTEADRDIVAWHEAGHTTAALTVPGADRPVSVSIIPRGPSGGATWMDGSDDQFTTRSKAVGSLIVAMAGRAAEEILLDGDYTHGAHGDLASATNLANAMVTQLGMGSVKRFVPEEAVYMGGDLANEVNKEIQGLIEDALKSAREVVIRHDVLLRALVAALLEKETLSDLDIREIYAQCEGKELPPAAGELE